MVTLWGRAGSAHLAQLRGTRTNEFLTLPEDICLTDDLATAIRTAEIVIISIHAQALRSFLRDLRAQGYGEELADKYVILCMKGIEIGTGKRLTTVVHEELGAEIRPVVWVGPGHVQDFVRGIPNCMVLAGEDREALHTLVDVLGSPLIRFYYGEDLLGTEVGAAAKNVIGLAAGMLDGLGYGSLKGALMARGTRELVRLVRAHLRALASRRLRGDALLPAQQQPPLWRGSGARYGRSLSQDRRGRVYGGGTYGTV